MNTIEKKIDVTKCIKELNFQDIIKELKNNIWLKGSINNTDELLINFTNEKLNIEHYKNHLIKRYINARN